MEINNHGYRTGTPEWNAEHLPLSKYYLNEHGKLVFRNVKNPFLFAQRAYRWVDRIIFIDESDGTRKYAGEMKYTDDKFILHEWEPMSPEIYSYSGGSFTEAYRVFPTTELCEKIIYNAREATGIPVYDLELSSMFKSLT